MTRLFLHPCHPACCSGLKDTLPLRREHSAACDLPSCLLQRPEGHADPLPDGRQRAVAHGGWMCSYALLSSHKRYMPVSRSSIARLVAVAWDCRRGHGTTAMLHQCAPPQLNQCTPVLRRCRSAAAAGGTLAEEWWTAMQRTRTTGTAGCGATCTSQPSRQSSAPALPIWRAVAQPAPASQVGRAAHLHY